MTKPAARNWPGSELTWSRTFAFVIAVFGIGAFAGCEKTKTVLPAKTGSETDAAPPAAIEAPGNSAPATTPTATVSAPATLREAARELDLTNAPLMKGAEAPSERNVTGLSYRVSGSVEAAFKFHQEQLKEKGWSEQAGSSVMPHSASATFDKDGLHLSLSVIPDKPGTAFVSLRHHGNLDFTKLPLPEGAKVVYAGPLTAIYTTEQSADSAAKSLGDSLVKAGWVRYGDAGNTEWFLKNAIRLSVTIAAAPGQGGKTTMNFGSEMLPAEIPAIPDATELQFSSSQKRLSFKTSKTQEECVTFYRENLRSAGWTTTMDAPAKDEGDQVLVFRNKGGDMLKLAMHTLPAGGLMVALDYQGAAEIEEMNRKLDAQAEAFRNRKRVAP